MSFEDWCDKVNYIFIIRTGLDRDTWPDQNYYDMWDSGMTPEDAFIEAIENEYGAEGLVAFGLTS